MSRFGVLRQEGCGWKGRLGRNGVGCQGERRGLGRKGFQFLREGLGRTGFQFFRRGLGRKCLKAFVKGRGLGRNGLPGFSDLEICLNPGGPEVRDLGTRLNFSVISCRSSSSVGQSLTMAVVETTEASPAALCVSKRAREKPGLFSVICSIRSVYSWRWWSGSS